MASRNVVARRSAAWSEPNGSGQDVPPAASGARAATLPAAPAGAASDGRNAAAADARVPGRSETDAPAPSASTARRPYGVRRRTMLLPPVLVRLLRVTKT